MGCGKTVVAFLGLLEVIDAGYQVLSEPSFVHQSVRKIEYGLNLSEELGLDNKVILPEIACVKLSGQDIHTLQFIDKDFALKLQGALMAPTEFLAIQHFQRITSWLEVLEDSERPRVALLTGSTPTARARVIRNVLLSPTSNSQHRSSFSFTPCSLPVWKI